MIEQILGHLKIIIVSISSMVIAIVSMVKIFYPMMKKKPKEAKWADLKKHTIFATLLEKQYCDIHPDKVKSKLKREMVQASLISRYKMWYDDLLYLVNHDGIVDGEYVMQDSVSLSKWSYGIISRIKIEQLRLFPKEYVNRFSDDYIMEIGRITHKTVEDIFSNNIYDNDVEKMYAILGTFENTIEALYVIGIATANNMNGTLEKILIEREKKND